MSERVRIVGGKESQVKQAEPSLGRLLTVLRSKAEGTLTERCRAMFERVDETFLALADRATSNQQQTQYFDAMRVLRAKRQRVEASFIDNYRMLYGNLRSPRRSAGAESAPLREDNLELVTHDVLEVNIAVKNISKRVEEAHARELQLLAKCFESVLPCAIGDDNNPLGPAVVVNAFVAAIECCELGVRVKLVVFKLFEQQVVSAWGEVIRQSANRLRAAGAAAKVFPGRASTPGPERVAEPVPDDIPTLDDPVEALEPEPEPQPAAKAAPEPEPPVQPSVADDDRTEPPHSYSDQAINPMVARISQILAGGQGAAPTPDQPESEWTAEQQQHTEHAIEALARAMFLKVSQQLALSTQVVPQMQALERGIIRLAMRDLSFFDSAQHPARRLVNEVAHAVVGFSADDNVERDPLYRQVTELVETLQANNVTADQLTEMLNDFMAHVRKEQRRSDMLQGRLMDEEAARIRMNATHSQVKRELEGLMSGQQLPRGLVNFVEQGWGKVMFLHLLREGEESPQWRASRQVIQCIVDLSQPGKAIPPYFNIDKLMDDVRQQLEESALDPYQVDSLVRSLYSWIESRLYSKGGAPVELVAVTRLNLNIPGQPFEDDSATAAYVEEHYLQQIDQLQPGDWVEFIATGEAPCRARYAGPIGELDRHLFVNRRGMKVAEMSRKQLALELKQGRFSLLDSSALFDRALEGIDQGLQGGIFKFEATA